LDRSAAAYLNRDITEQRERILRGELPSRKLSIFDEIHKYRRWRNYLKGLYDGRPRGQRILVTGSGRLDLYRFGGDSLQGRYHLLRLHRFSVAELEIDDSSSWIQLLTLGGFPEQFLSGKHYQMHWSLVTNDAARFENLVASHLLKWVHYEQDSAGRDSDVRYFRDVDRREVDFVVTDRGRPIKLVECKWSDADIDSGLRYLHAKYPSVEAWQISAVGTKDYQTPDDIRVAPAIELLKALI
jgi:predicted AAA+ superfamily ATPase